MKRKLLSCDHWGKPNDPRKKRPREERETDDELARGKYKLALVDILLPKTKYWTLTKPKMTVSFTRDENADIEVPLTEMGFPSEFDIGARRNRGDTSVNCSTFTLSFNGVTKQWSFNVPSTSDVTISFERGLAARQNDVIGSHLLVVSFTDYVDEVKGRKHIVPAGHPEFCHSVNKLRFLVLDDNVSTDAKYRSEIPRYSFNEIPTIILEKIILYGDFKDNDEILDIIAMLVPESITSIRGLLKYKHVKIDGTLTSRQTQVLASPSFIEEIECVRLLDPLEWERLLRCRHLKKIVVTDDVSKTSSAHVEPNRPYFEMNDVPPSSPAPFSETTEVVSFSSQYQSDGVTFAMTRLLDLPNFTNLTSLELDPAPDARAWLTFPTKSFEKIQYLSVFISENSHVPIWKFRNLQGLCWKVQNNHAAVSLDLQSHMRRLRKLELLIVHDALDRTQAILKAIKKEGLPIQAIEINQGMKISTRLDQLLDNVHYVGVQFLVTSSPSVSGPDTFGKKFRNLMQTSRCLRLASASNTTFQNGFRRKLTTCPEANRGHIRNIVNSAGREVTEYSRDPMHTRSFFLGRFPFLRE